MRRATNPDEFKLKMQGIQFTSDVSREEMESSLEMPGGDLCDRLAVRDRADRGSEGLRRSVAGAPAGAGAESRFETGGRASIGFHWETGGLSARASAPMGGAGAGDR